MKKRPDCGETSPADIHTCQIPGSPAWTEFVSRKMAEQPAQPPIRCQHKIDGGGVCNLHNLHCGWPKCNEPAQQEPTSLETVASGEKWPVSSDPLTQLQLAAVIAHRDASPQPAQQRSLDMKFGGCPFCGSQSCVAGQCRKPAQQQEPSIPVSAYDRLNALNESNAARIIELQDRIDAMMPPKAQQEPVAQWQKRHPTMTEGKWINTSEGDAKWWRDNYKDFEIRDLYTSPPQRKPLTRERVKELLSEAGYDSANAQARADFINGIRHAEAAHGIS